MARPRRVLSVFFWILASGTLLFFVGDGHRTVAAAGPGGSSHFVMLFPALATAPAPAWLRQGTRITYSSSAASGYGYGFPAGGGVTQVNVVCLDRAVAVLEIKSYGSSVGGPLTLLAFSGVVGLPGAGDDFWLSPRVLAGVQNGAGPGLGIVRMPYPINGTKYDSIRIQSDGQSWNYDLNTGVLLHSNAEAPGHHGQNTLAGVSTPNLPWAAAPAPAWVARTRFLKYDGAINVYVPGNPPVPIPISLTFQWKNGGPNWALYHQTIVQATGTGVPITTEADRAFGPAVVGGLWVAPQALQRLRPGQVVDRDPVTQVVVSVGQIGRTSQGNSAVMISEIATAQNINSVYDLNTGMLLFVSNYNRLTGQEIQLRLAARQ